MTKLTFGSIIARYLMRTRSGFLRQFSEEMYHMAEMSSGPAQPDTYQGINLNTENDCDVLLPEAASLHAALRWHSNHGVALFDGNGFDQNSNYSDTYISAIGLEYIQTSHTEEAAALLDTAMDIARDCALAWRNDHDFDFCSELVHRFLSQEDFFNSLDLSTQRSIVRDGEKILGHLREQTFLRAQATKEETDPERAERAFVRIMKGAALIDEVVHKCKTSLRFAEQPYPGCYIP